MSNVKVLFTKTWVLSPVVSLYSPQVLKYSFESGEVWVRVVSNKFWLEHRIGICCLLQPQMFPLLKYCSIRLSCFLYVIDSLFFVEDKGDSFPTSLRFLLPASGSFHTLRFISESVFTCIHLWSLYFCFPFLPLVFWRKGGRVPSTRHPGTPMQISSG